MREDVSVTIYDLVICSCMKEEEGGPYKASVPLLHATTPEADILLAYEMNGKVYSTASAVA
jgi:sulfite oxidase